MIPLAASAPFRRASKNTEILILSMHYSDSGARPQNAGWSLIRCGGVFFLSLTAYDVVRQEAPDDHFLKGSSRETRAPQGRADADQRSPSWLSDCPIPQVWQAELPLCAERLPGTRPLLLADSCQRWKDHHPSHSPRTGGRSYPGADCRIPPFSQAGARTDRRERTARQCSAAAAGSAGCRGE